MTTGHPYAAYRSWAETPLTETPRVSVVIPAYNEEFRIVPTIGAIATYMSSRNEPWELIVADDGSTDTTVELVKELGLVNQHAMDVALVQLRTRGFEQVVFPFENRGLRPQPDA